MDHNMSNKAPPNLVLSLHVHSKIGKEHEVECVHGYEYLVNNFDSASEPCFKWHIISIVDEHCQVQIIHCDKLEVYGIPHEQCENYEENSSHCKHEVESYLGFGVDLEFFVQVTKLIFVGLRLKNLLVLADHVDEGSRSHYENQDHYCVLAEL